MRNVSAIFIMYSLDLFFWSVQDILNENVSMMFQGSYTQIKQELRDVVLQKNKMLQDEPWIRFNYRSSGVKPSFLWAERTCGNCYYLKRGKIRLSPAIVTLCRKATGRSSKLNACPLFSLTGRFGLFEFRKHFFFLLCLSEIPAEGSESAHRGEISKTQIRGEKLK